MFCFDFFDHFIIAGLRLRFDDFTVFLADESNNLAQYYRIPKQKPTFCCGTLFVEGTIVLSPNFTSAKESGLSINNIIFILQYSNSFHKINQT